VEPFLIVANDRVEDGPHDFREVDLAQVIPNVQTLHDLVQLVLLYLHVLVTQRWRQSLEELGKFFSLQVHVAIRIELRPRLQEGRDVTPLQRQELHRVVTLLHVLELFINDSDEHVEEDEERD